MSDDPDIRDRAEWSELLKQGFDIMQANVEAALNISPARAAMREPRMPLVLAGIIGVAAVAMEYLRMLLDHHTKLFGWPRKFFRPFLGRGLSPGRRRLQK